MDEIRNKEIREALKKMQKIQLFLSKFDNIYFEIGSSWEYLDVKFSCIALTRGQYFGLIVSRGQKNITLEVEKFINDINQYLFPLYEVSLEDYLIEEI